VEAEKSDLEASKDKVSKLHLKNKRDRGMAQMVEYLHTRERPWCQSPVPSKQKTGGAGIGANSLIFSFVSKSLHYSYSLPSLYAIFNENASASRVRYIFF
jgi:hypothetical protein